MSCTPIELPATVTVAAFVTVIFPLPAVAATPSTPETLPLSVMAVLPLPVTTVLMPTLLLEVIAPLAVIVIPPLPPPVIRASIPWSCELIRPLVMVMPPVAVSAAIPKSAGRGNAVGHVPTARCRRQPSPR